MEDTVYQIFLTGGWLMWPLLICSIIVVAISIERLITLQSRSHCSQRLYYPSLAAVAGSRAGRRELRELRDASPLGYILAAGISNSGHGREIMKDSIEEAAAQVVHELERFLTLLSTIANMAPLDRFAGHCVGYDSGVCRYYAVRHRQCR